MHLFNTGLYNACCDKANPQHNYGGHVHGIYATWTSGFILCLRPANYVVSHWLDAYKNDTWNVVINVPAERKSQSIMESIFTAADIVLAVTVQQWI